MKQYFWKYNCWKVCIFFYFLYILHTSWFIISEWTWPTKCTFIVMGHIYTTLLLAHMDQQIAHSLSCCISFAGNFTHTFHTTIIYYHRVLTSASLLRPWLHTTTSLSASSSSSIRKALKQRNNVTSENQGKGYTNIWNKLLHILQKHLKSKVWSLISMHHWANSNKVQFNWILENMNDGFVHKHFNANKLSLSHKL